MALINQEVTYTAAPSSGSTDVKYEFTVTPNSGFTITPGFATLNNSLNSNSVLKITFNVAQNYTIKVVAKNICTSIVIEDTIIEEVSLVNTQSGFKYLTPATRRFQFGNEDGIKFLNQDGSIDKNQMRIVYNSATNTISDLDWNVNNYNLPKAWRVNTEPFKTTPLTNIVIPTFMYGKPITVEVQYYDGNSQVHRYYPFQQSFIIN